MFQIYEGVLRVYIIFLECMQCSDPCNGTNSILYFIKCCFTDPAYRRPKVGPHEPLHWYGSGGCFPSSAKSEAANYNFLFISYLGVTRPRTYSILEVPFQTGRSANCAIRSGYRITNILMEYTCSFRRYSKT